MSAPNKETLDRVAALEAELAELKKHTGALEASETTFYASEHALKSTRWDPKDIPFPVQGHNAKHVLEFIVQEQELDVSLMV